MNIPKYVEMYRKDLKLKNYSDNTIKNYVVQVDIFLRHQEKYFTEPSKINESSIKNWLLQFNTRNSMCHSISALLWVGSSPNHSISSCGCSFGVRKYSYCVGCI